MSSSFSKLYRRRSPQFHLLPSSGFHLQACRLDEIPLPISYRTRALVTPQVKRRSATKHEALLLMKMCRKAFRYPFTSPIHLSRKPNRNIKNGPSQEQIGRKTPLRGENYWHGSTQIYLFRAVVANGFSSPHHLPSRRCFSFASRNSRSLTRVTK